MSIENVNSAANIAHDVKAQGPNEYTIISSPRELAEVSRAAQAGGFYDADFENKLAFSLKHSIQSHGYKRVSMPTPPPANIVAALNSRVR